ncbi:hypothetical protein [Aneurinibacillus thermoaerophilus]|nr:hypothetical protein [Aneurinibacillus thermoaerophilus]MED0737804.1 hypothetical protein [Aneurinibacillus thermoaerophilus]
MNKRYFSRVDKTGAILLLEDLQKLVHAGKREYIQKTASLH